MPDVREVGQVSDIDGMPVIIGTQGDRIWLRIGTRVAVLDETGAEDFGRLFVRASWEAARRGPEPSW